MVTVLNAWTQRGWSCRDHDIDDSRMAEVCGRDFATVEHARRAVVARADSKGFASFEYELKGRRYVYDSSPSLPGRDVTRIRELQS